MKKYLLSLLFTFVTFVIAFAQSSGSFVGTVIPANGCSTHTFTSSGNGKYLFTGITSPGGGEYTWVTAYIGEYNNYNIGSDYDYTNDSLTFESNCVETGQIIGVCINAVGSENIEYTLNYQFIPPTYSIDEEPNDTYEMAIPAQDSIYYEGWFNNGDNPIYIDNKDWYKFTSPSDGQLVITLHDGNGYTGTSPDLILYDSFGSSISPSSIIEDGAITLFKYEEFNYSGEDFGIKVFGNCTNYKFQWHLNNNAIGIDKLDINNLVELYPNPSKGLVRVEAEGMKKIKLYNIQGKHIYSSEVLNNTTTVDLRNHTKGICFVKVIMSDRVVVKKLIIE